MVTTSARGVVESVGDGLVAIRLPHAAVGDGVRIGEEVIGEVRRIDGQTAYVAVHSATDGLTAGTPARVDRSVERMPLGTCVLGRAIDAHGEPLDNGSRLQGPLVRVSICVPGRRAPIERPFWTGIRAIDALLTFGVGARIGIFGPPGCGKSTLLEQIVHASSADAVVVALIGERGREAQEWIALRDPNTTVICATSDRSAAERTRAVHVAFAQACALRARGLDVLVLLDSLARVASALRELAVANGESTGRGGYPPSVFAGIARLVETGGATEHGSMTLVATVLDDGDERDPVSDAARSLLDGHFQLSQQLARKGCFPALDVPGSVSRTMASVAQASHLRAAHVVRSALAALDRTSDARALGLPIAEEAVRRAAALEARLEAFVRQEARCESWPVTLETLEKIARELGG